MRPTAWMIGRGFLAGLLVALLLVWLTPSRGRPAEFDWLVQAVEDAAAELTQFVMTTGDRLWK